jgi:hypothetical protein
MSKSHGGITAEQNALVLELRKRMSGVAPPLDEDDFFDVDDT